jgi:tRNA(Glu) U13 pseudouridine synthase TruD
MNTMEVQQTLSHILGYNDPRMVGFCGLKDKYALTTQTFSVPSYNNI